MLPRNNPIYHGSYGIQGLREQLDRLAGGRAIDRLRNSHSAWSRLLALFQLVDQGSAHEALPVPSYGGGLFTPGRADAKDPILRSLIAFEQTIDSPSDAVVYRILELLCRSQVKVRQGRGSVWVEAPVDFSDLSSEYIGILYEGLLDFELRQAAAQEPIIFLNLGDQPALPLTRLEGMDDEALAALVEKLKQKVKAGETEDADEAETADEAAAETAAPEAEREESPAIADVEGIVADADQVAQLRERAQQWARKAVEVGKLVAKPKSRKPQALEDYQKAVQKTAAGLIARVVLPGEWFLVRWGGTRKGSGTFYPRPQLAIPTVRRMLQPLVYEDGETQQTIDVERRAIAAKSPIAPPLNATNEALNSEFQAQNSAIADQSSIVSLQNSTDGGLNSKFPAQNSNDGVLNSDVVPQNSIAAGFTQSAARIPRDPEEILALKICDPAMGSGSFLIAALRYLTDVLYESLHHYDRIPIQGSEVLCRLPDGQKTNLMSDRTLPVPPDHPEFEARLKAALKRFVVEWCLYGVDIDPLAVELARLSLWVETMDRSLPFSFLDHKLKCGNSLVGCWFEQFQDYPVMAWEREGGDVGHDRFVHHFREFVVAKGKKQGQQARSGDVWNQAIKEIKNGVVRSDLKDAVVGQLSLFQEMAEPPKQTHALARKSYQDTHEAVFRPEIQEETYRAQIEQRAEYQELKRAYDTWCAIWFWSPECLELAPLPTQFDRLSPEALAVVEQLAEQYQFFHWEIEFPDVFGAANSGFDAVVGNPPWEIQKPNSKEFFSNIDPLYRTYGKQEALNKQLEYFENPQIERDWLAYCDRLKALSNWSKFWAFPFGDYADEETVGSKYSLSRSAAESKKLHDEWRRQRAKREAGFTTQHFPFRQQGSADVNTYKLFSELGYTIARQGGRFGFITPSGIYSDKGTGKLRDLFLKRCSWTHLYAFQNERFVFGSIHHSFKMVVATLTKGGETGEVATRFRLGPGDSPEAYELTADILDAGGYLSVPVDQILKFSPNTGALLEIRTDRDLKILEKMYANGILLGDQSANGWGIRYAREFDMTNDSKLFSPRSQWEAKGYRSDEYGHWLKGNWRSHQGIESGTILSADGEWAIGLDEVEDVALPFYQGIMIRHLDFAAATYESGSGNRAVWRESAWDAKKIIPQFLISAKDLYSSPKFKNSPKVAYRRIAPSTNSRTLISTVLTRFGCGDSLFLYVPEKDLLRTALTVSGLFSTFTYDYQIRIRLVGANLSEFIMSDTAMPKKSSFGNWWTSFYTYVARLSLTSEVWAQDWLELAKDFPNTKWKQLWAITPHDRLRLRALLDAIVAHLYGLDETDFRWILRDCDHPIDRVTDKAIARTFDPKGFWRVDKDKPPELRHTVLAQIAFHELQAIGLEAFLALNNGEGWMLPATLRLADYELGHDDRAQEPQPVAEPMGDRFLAWQLEGTAEESWAECDRHAENLRRLLGNAPHPPAPSPPVGEGGQEVGELEIGAIGSAPLSQSGRGAGGEGLNRETTTQQLGLFDTLEE